ncbi:MAG: glycosylhydrolase-like jelly roll fold domain-containing protein, partial [Burkholderiales bacterium]
FKPPVDAEIAPHVRGGYNFDGCSPDALLTRVSVKEGRLVLPDGMSYWLLVLPKVETMTPRLLEKIKQLADAGALILGNKTPPKKSPSFGDLGEGDAKVQQLAAALWPKIITGKTVAEVLGSRGVVPDFQAQPILRYIHRQTEEADLYFVANPEAKEVTAQAAFRVSGKQPEFWFPDTGQIVPVEEFEQQGGVTRLPMHLDPYGSVFVVFRKATEKQKATGKNWQTFTPMQELSGPWRVRFDPKWGGPAQPVGFQTLSDWSKHADQGIKYYSGAATYRMSFEAKATQGKRVYLDLGRVAVMAEVILNGRNLGIAWKQPYRLDVTEALKAGENELEIKVVNLWVNRLIGDEQLPEDSNRDGLGDALRDWPQWLLEGKPSPTGRYTFTTHRLWKKNDPLVESGLLGPVTLLKAE